MVAFTAEVNVSETWVPTKELRRTRSGEIKPKLVKVRVANVTLTAPQEINTLWYAHNLRVSRVRRNGETYYTLSELREQRDRWTGQVTVADKWTRVKGPSGRPENWSLFEAGKFLKERVGVEEAIKILVQIQ